MRAIVSTLMVVCLLAVLGCDSNDKNTLSPIPKSHKLNPVFSVVIDNNHKTIPGREIQLTVDTPSIGWTGEVFTDTIGFIGTLGSGTFISAINTTIHFPGTDSSDTIVDTTYVTYSFLPSQTYTFGLHRVDPLQWVDSCAAVYARTIDSTWIRDESKMYEILTIEPGDTTIFSIDSVAEVDTATIVSNPPVDTVRQELLYGYWFDTAYVITNPADTEGFPPDSTYQATILWGFWGDSVTMGHVVTHADSATWCAYDMCFWYDLLDTVVVPGGAWGNYDTVTHAVPDTTKGLIFGATDLSVYNWVMKESVFVGDTVAASLYLINEALNDTTIWNGSSFQITMPASDVYSQPDYKVVIKN